MITPQLLLLQDTLTTSWVGTRSGLDMVAKMKIFYAAGN
jgi:hypothetical protein